VRRGTLQGRSSERSGRRAEKDPGAPPAGPGLVAGAPPGVAARERPAYAPTWALTQDVWTDFGRVIGVPSARLMMSCASMPSARETPKSTV
jgi:hypothetical protein